MALIDSPRGSDGKVLAVPAEARVPGQELFDAVVRYESFGHHRTGTSADRATAAWVAAELTGRALSVEMVDVPFQRWDCSSSVVINGRPVDHLAVPYEWVGELRTTNVYVAEIAAGLGGNHAAFAESVRLACAGGFDAAVLATRHVNGALVGINRPVPDVVGDFPVFLIAGSEIDGLDTAVVEVTATACLSTAQTTNVIGRNSVGLDATRSAPVGGRQMLTTPLTGWFGCAGERGTGVAVLLDMAGRLAGIRPILIVVTGGHELGWFGADQWVDEWLAAPDAEPISSVVHIGASVAVEESGPAGRLLADTRFALTSLDEADTGPLASALEPARLALRSAATSWIGEGEAWCRLGIPMVSITGVSSTFHTPLDTASRVTSAAALATVAEAIYCASDLLAGVSLD